MDLDFKNAGGIIPYIKKLNESSIYFLLGYENNKWSGFVGKYEECDNKNIINTAIREFNEETAELFQDNLDILKHKLIYNDCLLIQTKTKNRDVYIYFVEMDESVLDLDIQSKFLDKYNSMENTFFKEKTHIKWINDRELSDYECLYELKKIIFHNLNRF